jgi:peptidyl-prolyl cis-trans isomerase SurA
MAINKLLVATAVAFTSFTVQAQKMLVDEVVAIVGDDAILRSDIEYQYEQALIDGANYSGDMKCHIFEQILIQKLMVNQAKIDSISVGENEVTNQVDQRINYSFSKWVVKINLKSTSISPLCK